MRLFDPALILFVVCVVAWLALEAFLLATGQATVSRRGRDLFYTYPPIGMLAGLVVGLLLGHFFWQ